MDDADRAALGRPVQNPAYCPSHRFFYVQGSMRPFIMMIVWAARRGILRANFQCDTLWH